MADFVWFMNIIHRCYERTKGADIVDIGYYSVWRKTLLELQVSAKCIEESIHPVTHAEPIYGSPG
jgi:hypothetical protein